MDLRPFRRHLWGNSIAVATSVLYGATMRWAVSTKPPFALGPKGFDSLGVMTGAFLFFVPFVMGYLAVSARAALRAEAQQELPGIWSWIFYPWIPTAAMLLLVIAVGWEGSICVVMGAPIMFLMGSIGGIGAGILQRRRFCGTRLSAVALLPVALYLIEIHVPDPLSLRAVETDIHIHAPVDAVWQNVVRVPVITAEELPRSWVQSIGFPKPVEATLSHEGAGGVRKASFTGGLLFTETIDQWEPMHRISFGIHADTDQIPMTTLDEHARIGGRYFDVLEGEYLLEPQPDGNTLLRLISRERVSTHFNPYAGLWTDAVMRSIQRSILVVIQHRAEALHRS